jgi:hypothetical protein
MGGVPTKQIMHSVGAMGDLLVAIKGVSANEEDAAAMAQAMNKAIFAGRGRGLQQYDIFLPTGWEKQFVTYQARLDDLMARMGFAQGESLRRAGDPVGRIAVMQKKLDELGKQIGYGLVPYVSDAADNVGDLITELSKVENMPTIWGALVQTMRDLKTAIYGVDDANKAATESFGTWLGKWISSELKEDVKTLEDLASVLGWIRNIATFDISKYSAHPKQSWMSKFLDTSTDIWGHKVDPNLAPHWPWDARRATPTPPPYSGVPAPSAGLPTGRVNAGYNTPSGAVPLANAAAAAGAGQLASVAASSKLEPYKKIFEEAGAQYGIDPRLLLAIAKQENVAARDLNPLGISPGGGGAAHYANMQAAREAIFRQVALMSAGIYHGQGPYRKATTLAELAQIYSPIGAANDIYGTNATELAGWQAALAKMGADPNMPLRAGGDTHYHNNNFTPSVIIHGDATDEAQRAMDTRLRDLSQDFIEQMTRAQRQARRTSYEGGYA